MASRFLTRGSAQGRQLLCCLPSRCPQCRSSLHSIASPSQRRQHNPFTRRADVQRSLQSTPVCMSQKAPGVELHGEEVRVRFAPSPTGNLHVGGARTALFNYLFARRHGGKFILRIEDTDLARSTKESEEKVLADLRWLGMDWDEGPDIGGDKGPYRQSERNDIYKRYADQLVQSGTAYPCFCSDEELAEMKAEAAAKNLPPVYRGKWASASAEEVQAARDAGLECCYRFRVPKDTEIAIDDAIRGKVTWNTDTLGDFVILRSNGQPVYNFCVAVDDALMDISHVIRAEEHLPNSLRQVLIYKALGFEQPTFGHVSLILAGDKSKLSKRHGATSVGEFKEEGFLPDAMLNFLALLGWNDGSEQEIYSRQELIEKFSLDRITKSGAVFDKTKLAWMNGQYLRSLPDEELVPMVAAQWVNAGLLVGGDGHETSPFVRAAVHAAKTSLELLPDAIPELREYLSYPLEETLAADASAEVVADDFRQVADAVLAAYDSGALAEAAREGNAAFKDWLKKLGKEQKRKGKRLFMPARICLTGSMHGPEVGELLHMFAVEDGDIADRSAYVPLSDRMERLRKAIASMPVAEAVAA